MPTRGTSMISRWGEEGVEWGNNERDKGDGKMTHMVVQIELEDKTATDADRIESENKAAAIAMDRTHRALHVSQLKKIEK